MEAANTSGSLPKRTRVVEAFTNAELSNPAFLDLFASTPIIEAHAAILRCRTLYRTVLAKAQALAQSANSSTAADSFEDNLAHWMQ